MTRVIPRVDVAFKKIFGAEENKDLLISLINSIVSKEDQVVDLEIINPYNQKNFKKDKLSVLDIKAKDTSGQRYNIEMQVTDEADYDKRALYYWARVYSEQLEQAMDYGQLRKTIGIHILNFISIPNIDKYHNRFYLTEEKTGKRYFKDIELHTIELRKFENLSSTDELSGYLAKIKTALDCWVTFLTKYDLLDPDNLPKELSADPAIKKALNALEIINFTKAEREEYEAHLKWLRTEDSGIKKSFAKGKAVGIAEGKAAGLAEGKAEVAINLLAKGLNIKLISEATGLTEDEIKNITPLSQK